MGRKWARIQQYGRQGGHQSRIKPFGRCAVAERLMRAGAAVLLDVARDESAELGWRLVLADPHALALEAAEPPLHDHAVGPAGLAVHAMEHVAGRRQPLVGGGIEHRPLVGVEEGGRPVLLESGLRVGAHAHGAHVIDEPPACDEAGVPVDRAGQVCVHPPVRDEGDVYAPHLVGKAYGLLFSR